MKQQTKFFTKINNNTIRCTLCPHNCTLKENQKGICGTRINYNRILYTTIYGEVSAVNVDPMEKKPLFHFYPGEDILSLGTIGCNLKCPYCQNWNISQNTEYTTENVSPEDIINICKNKNIRHIAYTYSEPIIWYEFVYDTAKLANQNKINNVLVTNGYINKEPLKEIAPFIQAANIDVKAFNDRFYTHLIKGKLQPVLETVEYLYNKTHIEITMLIIPGWNDNLNEIKKFTDWVSSLSPDIPVHFSRYFPQYKFDTPATPLETLREIYDIAAEKLNYVYIGNAAIKDTENSYCPHCGNLLIERTYYNIKITGLHKNKCSKCGKTLNFKL